MFVTIGGRNPPNLFNWLHTVGKVMLEAIMILCFGLSWPMSIFRTLKVKQVTGKSEFFLWLVFAGYITGIFHKIFNAFDWVIVFYIINACMVFIDIVVFYIYRNRSKNGVII